MPGMIDGFDEITGWAIVAQPLDDNTIGNKYVVDIEFDSGAPEAVRRERMIAIRGLVESRMMSSIPPVTTAELRVR